MRSVLVIVDMQDYFLQRGLSRGDVADLQAEWDRIVEVIVAQIAVAKRNKIPIVVLEYAENRPSVDAILKAIKGYKLAKRTAKHEDDGSGEVLDVLTELVDDWEPWWPAEFRVTGVNRRFCVAATVEGLVRLFPQATVNLIEDGIGDEHGDIGWGWGKQPPNTVLTNSMAVS